MSASRLVFDIGGTNLRLALAENGALGVEEKQPTPQEPLEALDRVREFLARRAARPQEAVGGIAGIVHNGTVMRTGHLPRWDRFDLSTALEKKCGIARTSLYNDAEVAGIGEARAGAGKGKRSVGYLTIGTGVGGALILDGRVAPHEGGFEPGKQIIEAAENCTLESLVGGAALEEAFGQPPKELPPETLRSRVPYLAAGLYNLIRLWSPDIFVLGGSLIFGSNPYSLDEIAAAIAALPVDLPPLPPIARCTFHDRSGLMGAALAPLDD